MKRVSTAVSFCVMLLGYDGAAQCSDAGVCSIAGHSYNAQHNISFGYQFGKSTKTDDLTFHAVNLSADLHVLEASRLFLGIQYNSQSGPLGFTEDLGDVAVIWTQRLVNSESEQLSARIGGKITLADMKANKLPQAYQSSLGTNDLLVGLTYTYDAWDFTGAFQQPFGRSKNSVDRLKRGGDILVGVGYTHKVELLKVGGDLLFVQRLSKSSVLASSVGTNETFMTLSGSAQTQVNVVGRASYTLSTKTDVHGSLAIPLLKRKVNVDGLTRSVTASIGLTTTF